LNFVSPGFQRHREVSKLHRSSNDIRVKRLVDEQELHLGALI
jgi:hypothetical protein